MERDCAEKELTSGPETAILRKACLRVGIWELEFRVFPQFQY